MSDEDHTTIQDATPKIGARAITPENPMRLRECLAALSAHDSARVLRIEVQFGHSTDDPKVPALNIVVTHSLSEEREMELAPLIGKAFALVLNDAKGAVSSNTSRKGSDV